MPHSLGGQLFGERCMWYANKSSIDSPVTCPDRTLQWSCIEWSGQMHDSDTRGNKYIWGKDYVGVYIVPSRMGPQPLVSTIIQKSGALCYIRISQNDWKAWSTPRLWAPPKGIGTSDFPFKHHQLFRVMGALALLLTFLVAIIFKRESLALFPLSMQ